MHSSFILYYIIPHMKLDSRDKYDRIRRFLADIKTKPNIEPFLQIEQIPKFGIYDFCYVTKNPPSFSKIQKKLRQSKYDELQEFINDIKQIFLAVSDYILSDDPLQRICEDFRDDLDRFAAQFVEEFRATIIEFKPKGKIEPVKKIKEEPQPKPRPIEQIALAKQRPSNITEKLEMLFLLRANENNEPYIRSLGTHYNMGMELQDQYVMTLDSKNSCWLQFISRNAD